jgi:hypothetical protein
LIISPLFWADLIENHRYLIDNRRRLVLHSSF